MTRIALLFVGALAAVVFAAVVLVALPRLQLPGAPDAPARYTAEQLRGRALYIANGCFYCHSQQVRDPAIANDVERGWGRPSYPSDYADDAPALLGTMRTGPDLSNVGLRLPDPTWHLLHLYQPRALVPWSIMPSFPFLFTLHEALGPAQVPLAVPEAFRPAGRLVVPSQDAHDLVAYLLSLRRDSPPPELQAPEPPRRTGAP